MINYLRDIQVHNREADRELFREYAQAFHGARQLTWSVGLRTRYAVGPELADAELAVQGSAAGDALGAIPQVAWSRVVELRMQALILDHAERDGWPAVERLLTSAGISLHTADLPGSV